MAAIGFQQTAERFSLDNDACRVQGPMRISGPTGSPTPLVQVQPAGTPWWAEFTLQPAAESVSVRIDPPDAHVARCEITAECRGGGRYRLCLELRAGEAGIRLDETMDTLCPDARIELSFPDFAPHALVLNGAPGNPVEIVDPRTYCAPYGVRENQLAAVGAQQIFGQIGTPWVVLADTGQALGCVVRNGGDWLYPGDNTLHLDRRGNTLVLTGEAEHGTRSWFLLAGAADQWVPKAGGSALALAHLKRDLNDLPPEKTARWVTDIADSQPEPVLWCDGRAGLAKARKCLVDPAWDGLVTSIPWREGDTRPHTEAESRCQGICGTTDSFPQGIHWLKTGEPEHGRQLARAITDWAATAAARFRDQGYQGHATDVVHLRTLKHCLFWYDLLRGSGLMIDTDADATRQALLFCAYVFHDRDYFDFESAYAPAWSEHGIRRFLLEEDYSDTMGCQNFHADIFSYIGAVGLAFPDHPRAKDWVGHAEAMTLLNLDCFVAPDGTYVESDNYYNHFLGLLYYLGWQLDRAGRPAVLRHPRMLAGLEYWVRAQTPPLRCTGAPDKAWYGTYTAEPARRPIVQVPPLGDAGLNWAGQAMPSFLHHAANHYRNEQPELAGWLEWTWQRAGRPLLHYNFQVQELLTQQLDGPEPKQYPLTSTVLQGHGVMLRAAPESPAETALLVRAGRATSHMHFDGGSITLWHNGVPLVVDPGYIHDERTPQRGYGAMTWKHSTVTFTPGFSGYLGMEHMQDPLAVNLGRDFDYVCCDLSLNNERRGALTWRGIERIVSVEHYRQVLLAKTRGYVVLKDRIYRSIYPGTWRLWVMGEPEQVGQNQVRVRGRYGVDLLITFLLPQKPAIEIGTYSTVAYLAVRQAPERDFLVVLQPLAAGEVPYDANPIPDGVAIRGPDWEEQVLLDPLPGLGAAGEWHAPAHDDGTAVRTLTPGLLGTAPNQVAARCAVFRDNTRVLMISK